MADLDEVATLTVQGVTDPSVDQVVAGLQAVSAAQTTVGVTADASATVQETAAARLTASQTSLAGSYDRLMAKQSESYAAQLQYASAQGVLDRSLANGIITAEQYASSQDLIEAKMLGIVDASTTAAAAAEELAAQQAAAGAAYDALSAQIDPAAAALTKFAAQQAVLDEAMAQGVITSTEYAASQDLIERSMLGVASGAQATAAAIAELEAVLAEAATQQAAVGAAYDSLMSKINPASAALTQFTNSQGTLDKALAAGIITQSEYAQSQNLVEQSMLGITSEAANVGGSLGGLSGLFAANTEEVGRNNEASQALRETAHTLDPALKGMGASVGGLTQFVGAARGGFELLAVAVAGAFAAALEAAGDAADTLTNKLSTLLSSASGGQQSFSALSAIAVSTGNDLATLATAYENILAKGSTGPNNLMMPPGSPITGMGPDQQEAIQEALLAISDDLKLSGATAKETSSAFTDLFGNIQKGGLVSEQTIEKLDLLSPKLVQDLASALGQGGGQEGVNQLEQLAAAGQLTVDQIVAAFKGMGPQIAAQMTNWEPTLEQSFDLLRSSFSNVMTQLAQTAGFTSIGAAIRALAADLQLLPSNLDTVATYLKGIGVAAAFAINPLAGLGAGMVLFGDDMSSLIGEGNNTAEVVKLLGIGLVALVNPLAAVALGFVTLQPEITAASGYMAEFTSYISDGQVKWPGFVEATVEGWQTIGQGIQFGAQMFGNGIAMIEGLLTGLGVAVAELPSLVMGGVSTAINAVLSAIESAINTAISYINDAISKINGMLPSSMNVPTIGNANLGQTNFGTSGSQYASDVGNAAAWGASGMTPVAPAAQPMTADQFQSLFNAGVDQVNSNLAQANSILNGIGLSSDQAVGGINMLPPGMGEISGAVHDMTSTTSDDLSSFHQSNDAGHAATKAAVDNGAASTKSAVEASSAELSDAMGSGFLDLGTFLRGIAEMNSGSSGVTPFAPGSPGGIAPASNSEFDASGNFLNGATVSLPANANNPYAPGTVSANTFNMLMANTPGYAPGTIAYGGSGGYGWNQGASMFLNTGADITFSGSGGPDSIYFPMYVSPGERLIVLPVGQTDLVPATGLPGSLAAGDFAQSSATDAAVIASGGGYGPGGATGASYNGLPVNSFAGAGSGALVQSAPDSPLSSPAPIGSPAPALGSGPGGMTGASYNGLPVYSFASGVDFVIPGSGPPDSVPLSLMVSPGERLIVLPASQAGLMPDLGLPSVSGGMSGSIYAASGLDVTLPGGRASAPLPSSNTSDLAREFADLKATISAFVDRMAKQPPVSVGDVHIHNPQDSRGVTQSARQASAALARTVAAASMRP